MAADAPKTPDELYGAEGDAVEAKAEPEKDLAQPWLDLIKDHDKAGFEDYHKRCDTIEKLYGDADRMASEARDSEFQIFWANVQVLKPSIYNRAPVPVVVPRFRDRRPLQRVTSEMLERSLVITFDQENIDGVMLQVRDDLAVLARGVGWLRYESGEKTPRYAGEQVCIEWVNRRDFAHDPARAWKEVDWVGKRSFLTRVEMKERFEDISGDAYLEADYRKRKDQNDHDDGKQKAEVWEIWCRSADRVVWVSEGVDECLDSGEPHLEIEGFFPCPEPVYSTKQPGSLIPIPDFVYYQDQISEINALTNRISALSAALKLKGFYPSGAGELADAVEAAIKATEDGAVLVGVANWAMVGGGAVEKAIAWLPIEMVANTITQLVQLRKILIDDVYQITGLADIMRGSTDPNETLGAQELKSQYGSIRIRDRQGSLVRFARDITRLCGEIMAENFSPKTLLAMSQMEIPTSAQIAGQVKVLAQQQAQITGMVQQAQQSPEAMQAAQQQPDQAKAMLEQAQGQLQQLADQIDKLKQTPTVEQVMAFLKDQRLRPFILDIETDSTIAPDEDAQKQRATEFITAVGGFMTQVVPLVTEMPQVAPVAAEFLKYVASQFRAGRMMEGMIDEFAEHMAQAAQSPKPNPEADALQAKMKADQQAHQADMQAKQLDQQGKQQDQQLKAAADQRAEQSQVTDTVLKERAAEHQTNLREREFALKAEGMKADQTRAAQTHAMSVQAHKQTMQRGALEVRGKAMDVKRSGIEAQQAAAEGSAEPGAETEQPSEMDMMEFDMDAKLTAALNGIGVALSQLAAPKRVVREGGQIVGVEPVTVQ